MLDEYKSQGREATDQRRLSGITSQARSLSCGRPRGPAGFDCRAPLAGDKRGVWELAEPWRQEIVLDVTFSPIIGIACQKGTGHSE